MSNCQKGRLVIQAAFFFAANKNWHLTDAAAKVPDKK
jgi:hypothetical protein